MASVSLTRRFSELEIDAIPDAPRDVIPEDEKKDEESTASATVVALHSSQTEEEVTTETIKNRKSITRQFSGQKTDIGRLAHLQFPFAVPQVEPGKSTVVLVNDSQGVQIGNTFVYNNPVTSPTTMKYNNAAPKLKKVDAEEKCLEDLLTVTERVSIDDLSGISTHVGANWKVLGRSLKYTDGQLDQFYLNFEKLRIREVVYQMLLDWKRTRTSKATVKSLAKHLYKSYEVDALIALHKLRFNQ